jgi:hypothetical protein
VTRSAGLVSLRQSVSRKARNRSRQSSTFPRRHKGLVDEALVDKPSFPPEVLEHGSEGGQVARPLGAHQPAQRADASELIETGQCPTAGIIHQ